MIIQKIALYPGIHSTSHWTCQVNCMGWPGYKSSDWLPTFILTAFPNHSFCRLLCALPFPYGASIELSRSQYLWDWEIWPSGAHSWAEMACTCLQWTDGFWFCNTRNCSVSSASPPTSTWLPAWLGASSYCRWWICSYFSFYTRRWQP